MLPIVWQSDSLIAINKPSGLPSQAAAGIESVETRIRLQLNLDAGYLALPHRLDRSVSGLLLVALTKKTARLISQQFESRMIVKSYLAIVRGHAKVEPLIWIDRLKKVKDEARAEISDQDDPDGRRCETRVESLGVDAGIGQSVLRLHPHTGRMHQLRVQASARGIPILGDTLYGGDPWPGEHDRIALHAEKLEFRHPKTGIQTQVRCLPDWLNEFGLDDPAISM
ncbi:MAG: RluA family pseudouridine synthase [Planctomycetota bacterium]